METDLGAPPDTEETQSPSEVADTSSDAPPDTFEPSQENTSTPAPVAHTPDAPPESYSTLQKSYETVADTDPEKNAKIKTLSNKTGQDPAYVENNLDGIQKSVEGPSTSLLAQWEKQYPDATKFLEDPANLAVAHDDLPKLMDHAKLVKDSTYLQRVGQRWNNLISIPAKGFSIGKDLGSDIVSNLATGTASLTRAVSYYEPMIEKLIRGIQLPGGALLPATTPMEEKAYQQFIEKNYTQPLEENASFMKTEQARSDEQGPFFSLGTARSALTGIFGMAPSLIAGPASMPAIIAAGSAGDTKAETLARGGTESQANFNAATHFLINYGLFAGVRIPGVKEASNAVAGEITKSFAKTGLEALLAGGNATLYGRLSDYLTGDSHALDNWIEETFKGAGTMMLQQHMMSVGGLIMHHMASQGPEAMAKVQEGIVKNQADVNRVFYEKNEKIAQESKLATRDPETHGAYLDSIMKDKKAVFSLESLESYYQKSNLDPEEEMKKLGFGDQYKQAKDTGYLEVPMSKWTEKAAGKPEYMGLADDYKDSVESFSKNEIKARTSEIQAGLEEADKAKKEEPKTEEAIFMEKARAVQKDMEANLKAIGEGKMATTSHVFGRFFGKLGFRTGQDPFELYKKMAYVLTGRKGETAGKGTITGLPDEAFQQRHDVGGTENPNWDQEKWILENKNRFTSSTGDYTNYTKRGGQESFEEWAKNGRAFEVNNDPNKSTEELAQDESEHQEYLKQEAEIIKLFGADAARLNSEELMKRAWDKAVETERLEIQRQRGKINQEAKHEQGNLSQNAEGTQTGRSGANENEALPGSSNAELGQGDVGREKPNFFQRLRESFQQSSADELGRTDVSRTTQGPQQNIFYNPKAKASTFFHEPAHSFLEIYRHMAEQEDTHKDIKDDFNKLLNWFGVEKASDIKKEHHEMFADAWTKKIREGSFPVKEPWLKRIFNRFSQWLKGEWLTAEESKIEVPKEISDVMNRMIATDEEIMKAEHDTGFNQSDYNDLPMKFKKQITKVRDSARQQAEDEVMKTLMVETTPEHKGMVEQERERITNEAESTVNELPIFKASREIEDSIGGESGPIDIAKRILEGKATPDEYAAFDSVATNNGFVNGPDFAKQLVSADASGLKKNEVAKLVALGMAKYQDKMKDPEQMRALAMKAIHSEKMTEVLAVEAQIYSKMTDKIIAEGKKENAKTEKKVGQLKELVSGLGEMPKEEFSAQDRAKAMLSAKLARSKAEELLDNRSTSDTGRPGPYYTMERNMAVKAERARKNGDFILASQYKEKQMLNHALARQAERNADNIEKEMKFQKKFKGSDEKISKSHDMDLVNVGREILAQHGSGRPSGQSASDYLETLKKYSTDSDTYENLKEMVDNVSGNSDKLDSMMYGDFKETSHVLRTLWDLSRSIKQTEIDGKMVDKQELVAKLIDVNNDMLKPKRKKNENDQSYQDRVNQAEAARTAKTQRKPTEMEKANLAFLDLKAATQMIQFWAEKMDINHENKPYQNTMVYKIRDAANKYRVAKIEQFQKLHDVIKPIEKSLDHRPIPAPELGGYVFRGTSEVMGALQHTGNASNLQKLIRGNGWGDFKKDEDGKLVIGADGKRVLDTSKWDAFIDRMHREGVLKKEHYDAMQKIWDIYKDLKPKIQEAHKRMYGFNWAEIEPSALKTPFGEYEGGYVPAKVDPYKNDDAKTRQEKDAIEGQYNGFSWPTTGKGATLKRVENYAAPLLMDLGLATNHLDWALRFINIEPHVKELGRIIFDKQFASSLKQVDPAAKSGLLAPWLQRSARQRVEIPSSSPAMDWIFRNLRKNTGQIMLTANFSDTLSRLMSIPMASLKVGPTHLANALLTYIRNPQALAEANKSESNFINARKGISGFDITQGINQVLNPSTWRKFVDWKDKHAYCLQEVVHHVMDNVVYLAAKNQALGEGKSLALAIREAEDTVIKTQGSFNPEEVSRAQTGSPMQQSLNMFWSFFNTQAEFLGTESTKILRDQGIKHKFARGLFVYTMGMAVPAVMWQTIHNVIGGRGLTGAKKNDDEDGTTGDYLHWFFGSQVEQAAQMIPGVGTVVKGLVEGRFEDNPIFSTIKTATQTLRGEEYSKLEEGKGARRFTRDALATIQLMTGLPTAWIARASSYAAGWANDEYEPEDAVDAARGVISGTPGNHVRR